MKVLTRCIPKDRIAAEQNGKLLSITTHRHMFHIHVWDQGNKNTVVFHEFTFEQFTRFFEQLRPGIADILTPP